MSPVCREAPVDGFAPNLAQPQGPPSKHLYRIFWWSVKGCGFCGGFENYHLPLTKPVAVNTGLALPHSPWSWLSVFIYPRDAMLVYYWMPPYVTVSPSQTVFYRNGWMDRTCFWHGFFFRPILHRFFEKIRVSLKIKAPPSGTLSQTLH